MALAINISELLNGKVIEWERLEFKQGWNLEDVIHTLCAFANDINNWGRGYIILGIAEHKGRPVLPPAGLNLDQMDKMQGEITQFCYQLQPHYMPIIQPYVYQEKHILILYAPAGDMRPYTAPEGLGKKGLARRFHYIRSGSRSIKAQGEQLRRLQELTARVPFDDRINQQMNLAKGPDEAFRPLNVGLLFFSTKPHRYFERAWIEVVIRKDEAGKDFSEKYFKEPLHKQLREALSFIRANVVSETVRKVSGQAEANRFYNFPFEAVEEALANAVYHKSYELGAPIEVQVWPDKIEVLSFPGPIPPINAQILAENKRIVARSYRNRRVGDFLKELHLTEGRGTGIPTIRRAMERNESPEPIFETDDQSTYLLTVLPINPGVSDLVGNQESNQESNQEDNQTVTILSYCLTPKSRKEVLLKINLSNQTKNYQRHIEPLVTENLLRMTIPESPKNRNQRYVTTQKGNFEYT